MSVEEVSIRELREYPDALKTVVAWIDMEWGAFSGRSLIETTEKFAREFESDKLPVSFVAFEKGAPIGIATLRTRDSVDWDPGKHPWICNVFVCDAARGRGVAGKLCRVLELVAADYGFSEMHLATIMPGYTLYHKLGYVEYKVVTKNGSAFRLMRRYLSSSSA